MENDKVDKNQLNNNTDDGNNKQGVHYVYLLVDKRESGRIFYVGQGINGRVFDHVKNAKDYECGKNKENKNVLRKIQEIGNNLEHVILRSGLTQNEANEVEASVIELLRYDKVGMNGKLCNIQKEYGPKERRIRSIDGNINFKDDYVQLDSKNFYLRVKVNTIDFNYKNKFMEGLHKVTDTMRAAKYVLLVDNLHVFAVFQSGLDVWEESADTPGLYYYKGKEVHNIEAQRDLIGRSVPKNRNKYVLLSDKKIRKQENDDKKENNK